MIEWARTFVEAARRLRRIVLARAAAKRGLCLAFTMTFALSAAALAEGQAYRGLLIPGTRDAPVSIGITIERFGGKLKGRFTSSPPLSGEGAFVADVRNIHQCEFTTNIGAGRSLAFDGYCLANTIEGNYTLKFPDGSMQAGQLHAKREESAKISRDKASAEGAAPLWTASACLRAHSTCLAACPHGDYNAEFMCSNRCRQRLAACKAKGSAPPAAAP